MAELAFPKRVQTLVDETSHTMTKAPRRLVEASRGALHMTQEEADHLLERGENLFEKLVERGEQMESEQMHRIEGWIKTWSERGEQMESEQMHRIESWFKTWSERGRHQLHVAEEQVEQQVRHVLEALHIPSADDIMRLDKEIDRISKKLNAYIMKSELAALPIQGYHDMTVKEIVPQLAGMDHDGLLAIQQFEMAHGNRRTILRDIEQRLAVGEPVAELA